MGHKVKYLDYLDGIDRGYLDKVYEYGFCIEPNASYLYSPYSPGKSPISMPIARLDMKQGRLEFIGDDGIDKDGQRYQNIDRYRRILTGVSVYSSLFRQPQDGGMPLTVPTHKPRLQRPGPGHSSE